MQNKSRPKPDECSHYTHPAGIHPIIDRRHRFPLSSALIQPCIQQKSTCRGKLTNFTGNGAKKPASPLTFQLSTAILV